jgi:hypothetical protein
MNKENVAGIVESNGKDKELIFIRVGSDERPAGKEDIENVQRHLAEASQLECPTYVSSHLVNIEVVPKSFFEGEPVILGC